MLNMVKVMICTFWGHSTGGKCTQVWTLQTGHPFDRYPPPQPNRGLSTYQWLHSSFNTVGFALGNDITHLQIWLTCERSQRIIRSFWKLRFPLRPGVSIRVILLYHRGPLSTTQQDPVFPHHSACSCMSHPRFGVCLPLQISSPPRT